jgi:hypothetical protein
MGYRIAMRRTVQLCCSVGRSEPPNFFAYVCITSDAERDQNQKSKFPKIGKSKIAKTKNPKIKNGKVQNLKCERSSSNLCRLRSADLKEKRRDSFDTFGAADRDAISRSFPYGLYISSSLGVLLNEEIDFAFSNSRTLVRSCKSISN